MLEQRYAELKTAEKGAIVSIVAYLLISILKLSVGYWANSSALRADGLNNFTDIIASVAILVGIKIARKPADDQHRYGHWKVETVASMITSFIMVLVGAQVLINSITAFINHKTTTPDPIAATVGIFSAVVMVLVFLYNRKLAKSVKSSALMAAAKDNLSDAYTSIGTAIAIFAASFGINWLDSLTAIIVGALIIWTGIQIFSESAFSLSDGFSREELRTYKADILAVPGVEKIVGLRGRTYGANVFLDVVVLMDGNLTVSESHEITEEIERILSEKHNIFDTDVHVEPVQSYKP
ncbi:cation transporter [Vagococcus coleopterorum]|uniref:Cation transporter n=1 Tax=Vagococcus coleopterorum TaxID=2714946 RepID=A0A6G8AN02_9ENTE|nr:cation diffusion facilitator family transporter [Vagococcus coleopterorum]QIL46376.1 cation transporter [Vagococcus coleopterorum]